MELIKINEEKCVKCGICAKVCPAKLIEMGKSGPFSLHTHCMGCGHCVAVCPQEAIDNVEAPLSGQRPRRFSMLEPEAVEEYLRTRRSVRNYQEEKVPHEVMKKLLDIARFAPTAVNSQGLSYLVIEDGEKLKKITQLVVDWMEEQLKENTPRGAHYAGLVDIYRKTGYDVVLRYSPSVVLALSPSDNPFAYSSACYALEYVEIYAPSLGLGTCWAGLLQTSIMNNKGPFMEILNISPEQSVAGALMVGYPKYSYQRLVDRNPLQVSWL